MDFAPWWRLSERQALKLTTRERRIRNGILNVRVAHIRLNRPEIRAAIDEVDAASMAQGMRVPLHAQDTSRQPAEHAPEAVNRHGCAALIDEHQARGAPGAALVSLQGPDGIALERVRTIKRALRPLNRQFMRLEVHRLPAKAHEFRHPEPVFKGEADHQRIALAMPATLRRLRQLVNFITGKVLSPACFIVRGTGADCPAFSVRVELNNSR